MMEDVRRAVLLLVLLAAACGQKGGSPTAPSPAPAPPPAPPPGTGSTTGQTIDAVDGRGVGSAAINGQGVSPATADAAGFFTLQSSAAGQYRLSITGASHVERQTSVTVPGAHARLTLIPTSFEMAAFDELCRTSGGRLQRWEDRPALIVQKTTLVFTNAFDNVFTATAQQMSDAEAAALVADLTFGLPQLSGGQFSTFASVTVESAAEGSSVPVQHAGAIMAARYQGLTAATTFWGFGRWATRGLGTVGGGIVMLDSGFDTSSSPFTQSLRVHELGHAMGYNHVTVRASVMNASARVQPNDFDRVASLIAFQRPPGNRSPDVDPDSISANLLPPAIAAPLVWAPPIH